jgi:hypothetical protein
MLWSGVLVAVGFRGTENLCSVQEIRVGCVPRAAMSNEVLTDGRLDRDFRISFLLFEGLFRDQQESWHGFAVQCLALEV